MTKSISASRSTPRFFTIPPEYAFVDALAAGLIEQVGKSPEALASVRVLLPTRRACRALADAFLRQSAGRPLLLPQMTPIGDIDEDEISLLAADDELLLAEAEEIPPAIPPLRRQMLLTELIAAIPGMSMGADQAARLAAELARLLDQIYTERLDFGRLHGLVPDRLAEHWQKTLTFLEIITEHWPRILASQGCIEAADRRNRLLQAQARIWRARPPETPVFVAGSTGSVPATADLIAAVASMPIGAVVLPGLDVDADDESWSALQPSHPQFAMARLLERVGADRRMVQIWPTSIRSSTATGRTRIVSDALRPAAVAPRGRGRAIDPTELGNVVRLDAPGPADEARAIALVMREVLELPDRTAALVTPDRALARRVAAELGRWNISVDDSAGVPLRTARPGTFLLLTANAVIERFAPIPLLAALKHPLASAGMSPGRLRRLVRQLERKALRGLRPPPGIEGLNEAIGENEDLQALMVTLESRLRSLSTLVEAGSASLSSLVESHITAAEAIAATDLQSGRERLWAGDEGDAMASFIADLIAAATVETIVDVTSYAPLLEALMTGRVVRPRFGGHPRLAIWGPLEARLQRADVMILGGLNEDMWPPRVSASPWMSRPMMQAFGLPLPERRIGLSAHDFCQAFAAPEVWLTRSQRVNGVPTVPSRWLLRLDSYLGQAAERLYARGHRYLAWQQALDAPSGPYVPPAPPAPKPPLSARPRKLSVTQIETWMGDPYAIYARHVLRLKALDPLDAPPSTADYGSSIHQALDQFVRENPRLLPEDAYDRLLDIGRRCFGAVLDRPGVYTFWWPRFERVAAWLIEQERRRRPEIVQSWTEVSGEVRLAVGKEPFTLTAKADRIDHLRAGSLEIIDYKTGSPPTLKKLKAGFAPQLPLEAAMAHHGGFDGIPRHPVSALTFWRLKGSTPAGEEKPVNEDVAVLAENALAGLSRLIEAFDREETGYDARPRPAYAPRFSDYAHLARVKEWAALDGEGDE